MCHYSSANGTRRQAHSSFAAIRSSSVALEQSFNNGVNRATNLRANLELFNLANARVSDIDYYFASRLAGEPLGGVYDIHMHPAVPRTVRLSLVVGF